MADRPVITKTHRTLIGVVAAGAFIIAGIGFAGSYSAVRVLATRKGFGLFAYVFPIGVDVGIAVLLALDLVLTWLRIPFPLLRQAAWTLTVGTIVFNAASSVGDPLAMGMHAIIPLLFIVVVEAARHAVGRIADITADRYMESVRLFRWILAPLPTFVLWRRMKLWELRSYDEVIRLEQNRLVYRTHLRAQYGRGWRYRAPLELLLPLKLARYGVPLDLEVVRGHQDFREVDPIVAPALEAPVPHTAPHPQPQDQPVPHPVSQSQSQPQSQPGEQSEAFGSPVRPYAQPQSQQPQPQQPQQSMQSQQPQSSVQPQPQPEAQPQPAVDPLVVNTLQTVVRNRHRRLLNVPDQAAQAVGEDQEAAAADPSTRGIGWLPNQQPPYPPPGPEAWFAPQREGEEPLDLYFEALTSFMETYNQEPDPRQLSEYLAAEYGTQVSPALLDRHWAELGKRYAERVETSS
ncbi:DUF2637 domain-containing protein [Streptacidiphilus anmyonensis]|uniref:DUF2637 domain-containing protein n=1 Tax=Streptacidiphilus anmyonensis TaxID=405782 RepID=UPI000A06AFB8|nr:DUF2637 domain-containing protein [Streptacidiphilus anmyonensis]